LFHSAIFSIMKSSGSSRDVKKARSRDRALFRPSFGIPFRIFWMTGGNMFSVIVNPCMSIGPPSYFFFSSFGAFSLPHSRASERSFLASPSITFGMNDFGSLIFRGSASVGLKSSIWSLSITIEAKAVFSWREYGALKRWREETKTTSTESSVDLIVSSTLNWVVFCLTCPPYVLELASSLAVLILQVSQKSISRCETLFIFPLQEGQSISFLFDFIDSTSVLHLMSGQTYLPITFFTVGLWHFGQRFSETSSPCSRSLSRVVSLRISWFIFSRI